MGFLTKVFGQSGILSYAFDLATIPSDIKGIEHQLETKQQEFQQVERKLNDYDLENLQHRSDLQAIQDETERLEAVLQTMIGMEDSLVSPIRIKLESLRKTNEEKLLIIEETKQKKIACLKEKRTVLAQEIKGFEEKLMYLREKIEE